MPTVSEKMEEESLFHAARAIGDPQLRAAFLDAKCVGQPKLREDVDLLLRATAVNDSFLDTPAMIRDSVVLQEAIPAEGPGCVVGPYTLVEQIGEGGFGIVFLAEQHVPIRRQVALKTIKPGMDSRQVISRFEGERQALAILDHSNIAKVLDAGITNSGRPFFVMELVRGVPITTYCDTHQLTPRERMSLFVPVCQAIQHAHQKGIIHRDLKPTNVLVADQDGVSIPKVIDFGVAKALGDDLCERSLSTGLEGIVGTLEYMSPEQADFRAVDIDTRADIYSLGVLLYELLTGSTPVTKQHLQQASGSEVLRIIREQEPVRPSSRVSESKEAQALIAARRMLDSARWSRELRGELDWIVMKCLEKDRKRRYPTANSLIRDIERYLNHEPVDAGPPSSAYRLRKFFRRNWGPVLAASLVVLALVFGILGTTWEMLRAEREKNRANAASERALQNLATSRANLDLAVSAVDQFFTKVSADERLREHDLRPLRIDLLKSAVEFHETLLASRGQDEFAQQDLAHSHRRLAELSAEIEDRERAIAHFQKAIEEFELLLKARPDDVHIQSELARCLYELGLSLTFLHDMGQAELRLQRSIDLLRNILTHDPRLASARQQLAHALARYAYAKSLTQRYAESQQAWREAIEQWEQLTREQPDQVQFASQLAHAYIQLAIVFLDQGLVHWREAERACQTALAIQREAVSRPTASDFERQILAEVLGRLARVKKVSSQNAEAIQFLRESIGLLERLREEHPSVLSHGYNLAVRYKQLGDCEELAGNKQAAEAAYRKSFELNDKLITLAPGNAVWESHLAQVLLDLGEFAQRAGDRTTALSYYERSKQLLELIRNREPRSKNVGDTLPYALNLRGQLLAELGRVEEGLGDCDRAIELTAKEPGRCENFRLDRSWVRLQGGDYVRAAEEATEALNSLSDHCDLRFLPPRFIFGARICCRAAELAREDDRRREPERQELADKYVAEAIDMLQTAMEGGLRDPVQLEAEEFEILSDVPEFVEIKRRLVSP